MTEISVPLANMETNVVMSAIKMSSNSAELLPYVV